MGRKMRSIYVLILFFHFSSLGLCQEVNLLSEFKKVSLHYAKLNRFELNLKVSYYDQNGDEVMNQNGKVIHTDKLHYVNMAGDITFTLKKDVVIVRNEGRVLVYNELVDDQDLNKTISDINISSMLDSLWIERNYLSYEIMDSKPHLLHVTVSDSENEHFESYEIIIDKRLNQLKSFNYYFRQTEEEEYLSKVCIEYFDESAKPNLKQEGLNLDYYVIKEKNAVEPAKKFKNYLFIDQRQKPDTHE